MIRGYIEVITNEVVQGWIYSADGKTRDKIVLAYSGDQCVGSGKVEHFRRDLAAAGLGDGYLGFSFGITIAPEDVGSVTVRFDGSDAVLLQPGAVVRSASDDSARPVDNRQLGDTRPVQDARPTEDRQSTARSPADPPPPDRSLRRRALTRQLAALAWQLTHARLSQTEYDFLRLIWSAGVYDRTLLRREAAGKPAVADPPLAVATELLESYLGTDADIKIVASVTSLSFREELDKVIANPALAPVVALYSSDRVAIRALEGSHITEDLTKAGMPRGNYVDYKINAEHLIMLDARVAAELYAPVGQTISIMTSTA